MKKILLIALTAGSLSACQMTAPWTTANSENETNDQPLAVQSDAESALTEVIINAEDPLAKPEVIPEVVVLSPQDQEILWERIRQQLTIAVPEQESLIVQRNWYLKNPAYMDRVAKRAEPFLHLIVDEIERRGLPLELALLPIVESAFDPFAYSHGRASGIWQFIPGTGLHYGLDINWWYDGRRDVYAATHAALDYLEALHRYFDGNWLHALAAYNSGEGRVAAAIRKNKSLGRSTDFWSLSLPRETRAYVPKLLALADILKRQDEYNFNFYPIANQPYLEVVSVDSQIDLAKAAEMSGLTLKELHHYNSGYNRWATAPDGPHRLLLPIDNALLLNEQLDQTNPKDWLQWTRHQVESGESLLVIAKQYQTTPDVIQSVNDLTGTIIRAGDHLLIPVAARDLDDYSLSADSRLTAKQARPNGKHRVNYSVRSGDTLWDISREYKVNLRQLAQWNGMAPTDMLQPGQNLVVWLNDVKESNASGVIRSLSYQVRNGDSLARIAGRFNVTIAQIEKWNQINRGNYLQPGQRLKLFVDVTKVSI